MQGSVVADRILQRAVSIIPLPALHAIIPMTQHPSYALRPCRAALSMGWLVLVVILFGAIISSIGATSSHGLAAFPAALHVATPAALDTSGEQVHEQAQEDEGTGSANQSAGADHPHHGTDHSHDKAHALPARWHSAALLLAGWFGRVRPWVERAQAFRLERPPMG